jgi:hypothetical protein
LLADKVVLPALAQPAVVEVVLVDIPVPAAVMVLGPRAALLDRGMVMPVLLVPEAAADKEHTVVDLLPQVEAVELV